MAYQGEPYVGDLALYYIAQKLESGQKSGSVKDAIGTRPDIGALDPINQFSENQKSTTFSTFFISVVFVSISRKVFCASSVLILSGKFNKLSAIVTATSF